MNPVRAGICPVAGEFTGSTFGRWCQNERHTFAGSFMEHILCLARDSDNVSLNDFKKYLTSELASLSYTDEMKKLIASGQFSEADMLEQLFREQPDDEFLNVEVITFSVRDYHTHKFIGSKEFIQIQYRNWQAWQSQKKQVARASP